MMEMGLPAAVGNEDALYPDIRASDFRMLHERGATF
jgi:hypothetical protein